MSALCACNKLKQWKTQKWFIGGLCYTVLEQLGCIGALLFGYFMMDMFLKGHKITTAQVASVQIVYILWNVANDLIAGVISDWYAHKFGSRLSLILPLQILWNITALLPFYYISIPVTIHYFLCISLNDGFFSFVAILRAGIIVDKITEKEKQRLKLSLITKPSQAIVAAIVTFVSYLFWNISDLSNFYIILYISIIISVISTIVAIFALKKLLNNPKYTNDDTDDDISDKESVHSDSGNNNNNTEPVHIENNNNKQLSNLEMINMSVEYTNMNKDNIEQKTVVSTSDNSTDNESTDTKFSSMKLFCKSVLKQKNLWFFVIPNVVNETQDVWKNAFQVIFVTILLNNWTLYSRTVFISFLNFSPVFIGMLALGLAQKVSIYRICFVTLFIKIIISSIGLFVWLFAEKNEWTFGISIYCAIYLILMVWMLQMWGVFFMINMGNLINEQKASRIDVGLPVLSTMTSRYWALHAFCAKPFNSVGPIVGTYVLENAGYSYTNGDVKFEDYDKTIQLRIQFACLVLVVLFIFSGTLLQIVFWKFYTLYGKRMELVHASLSNLKQTMKKSGNIRGSNEENLID
eukprot:454432_1